MPRTLLCRFAALILLISAPLSIAAQNTSNYDEDRRRAMELFDAHNYADALPLLEKLAGANSSDVVVQERLGILLAASALNTKDATLRKSLRERAKKHLLRAKELGSNSNLLKMALDAVEAPDQGDQPWSTSTEADRAMHEAEAAFNKGDIDSALASYQKALQLDPKLYHAALFAGDMYFIKGDQNIAREWFARAVAINPNIETAYRYWGDSFRKTGNEREACEKFVEAIVAEPYNDKSYVGLSQWARASKIPLAHPEVNIPSSVSTPKEGKVNITIDPSTLGNGKNDDGSGSWVVYGIIRASWIAEKFLKEYPAEKTYRHSLREEAEAIRMVLDLVKKDIQGGKVKKLDPSLDALMKLETAGFLEAYILFARVDKGIAQDYESYREKNREKLKQYWLQFVVKKAG